MGQRWQVYQDNKLLGTMSASEIRRALREGELDPFDLVSKEGSSEKVELVEVDEIFQEESSQISKAHEGFQSTPLPSAQWQTQTPQPPTKSNEQTQIASEPTPEAPQNDTPAFSKREAEEATSSKLSLPEIDVKANIKRPSKKKDPQSKATQMPQRIQQGSYSLKRKDKKFLLIDDKNRNLGPLTALEVQSLYHKGLLPKNVRVQRIGTDKKVAIRQFISAYSGKRMKALADQSAIRKAGAQPSVKVLNELHHLMNSKKLADKQRSKLPNIILAALGILIGVGLFFGIEQIKQQKVNQTPKINPPQLLAPSEEPKAPRVNKREITRRAPEPTKTLPKVNNTAPKRTPSRVPSISRRETTSRPEPTPVIRNRIQPTPVVPRVKEEKTEPTGPIQLAKSRAGSVINVGPLEFNSKELESCKIKCEITFKDSAGATLKAIFFKGAYYDRLKALGNRPVTLVGSSKLEGAELLVFIQDIK